MNSLPPSDRISDVLVLTPVELIASKVISYHNRRGKPKSFTDLRDLAVLLLKFPELKSSAGRVQERLRAEGQRDETIQDTWRQLVSQEIQFDEDADDEFLN